jgi:hypothetical protein
MNLLNYQKMQMDLSFFHLTRITAMLVLFLTGLFGCNIRKNEVTGKVQETTSSTYFHCIGEIDSIGLYLDNTVPKSIHTDTVWEDGGATGGDLTYSVYENGCSKSEIIWYGETGRRHELFYQFHHKVFFISTTICSYKMPISSENSKIAISTCDSCKIKMTEKDTISSCMQSTEIIKRAYEYAIPSYK